MNEPLPQPLQSEKREAIARACGWHFSRGCWWGERSICQDEPPDYFGSLDACHEMEKTLSDEQCELYFHWLHEICSTEDEAKEYPMRCYVHHTPAAKRAEAFYQVVCEKEAR